MNVGCLPCRSDGDQTCLIGSAGAQTEPGQTRCEHRSRLPTSGILRLCNVSRRRGAAGSLQRHGVTQPLAGFVEVELPPHLPVEVVLELGAKACVRITAAAQAELTAHLLKALCAPMPC